MVGGLVANSSMNLLCVLVGADGDGRRLAIIVDFDELRWFVDGQLLSLWIVFLVECNLHIWLHLFFDCSLFLQV